MNRFGKISKNRVRLLVILLMMTLSVFAWLQYRWFSRIAENEVDKVRESLTFSISHTSSREFQRFALLFDWIGRMRVVDLSDEQMVRDMITGLYTMFGPDGAIPYLIASAGFVVNSDSGPVEYTYDEGIWDKKQVDGGLMHAIQQDPMAADPTQLVIIDSDQDVPYSKTVIGRLSSTDKDYLLVVELDFDNFVDHYIMPAIYEAIDGFSVTWELTPADSDFAALFDQGVFIEQPYRFSPLSAMFGKSYIESHSLSIPTILRYSFDSPWFGDRADGGQLRKLEGSNLYERITTEQAGDINLVLGVKATRQGYVAIVERTFGWILIGGVLLTSLIGIVCILLLLQVYRLQRIQERDREFTASITHELRTPLTVINSAADNLSHNLIPQERVGTYGRLIQDQTRRLGDMIENILVYARMEGNHEYRVQEKPVIYEELFSYIRQTMEAVGSGHGITFHWDVGGVPYAGMANQELIQLVLNNIISNAVYHAYGPEGGVVRIISRYMSPGAIRIIIEDDGRGIDIQEQKRIFEPFYRDAVTAEYQEKGSGLGLFIAKRNIRMLGGSLELESPYKRMDGRTLSGCRFIVTIPYKEISDASHSDNRR